MAAWFYLTLINDETPEMTEHITARIETGLKTRAEIITKSKSESGITTRSRAESTIKERENGMAAITEKTEVVWHVGRV